MPRIFAPLLFFSAAVVSAADPLPSALFAWRETKAELDRIGDCYLAENFADGDFRLKRLAAQRSPYVDPRWATELDRLRAAEVDVRRIAGWSAVLRYETILERAKSQQERNDELEAWCLAMLGRSKAAADAYRGLRRWGQEASVCEARAVTTERSLDPGSNFDLKLQFIREVVLGKLPQQPLAEGLERRQALEALSRLTSLLETTTDGDQRREIYRWIRITMMRRRDDAGLKAWEDELIKEPSVRPHELAEISLRRAFVAHQAGDVAAAESLWQKIANEYPRTTSHVSARLNLGATLQQQQRFAEALAIHLELLRDPAVHPQTHAALSMRIASCYEGQKKYAEAITWVNKARPRVPACGCCVSLSVVQPQEWKDKTLQALVARLRE